MSYKTFLFNSWVTMHNLSSEPRLKNWRPLDYVAGTLQVILKFWFVYYIFYTIIMNGSIYRSRKNV